MLTVQAQSFADRRAAMADFLTICLFVVVACVGAQRTYKRPEIYSLNIYSDIKYRFATTRITSRVKNNDTEPREATFDVTLPNEAFITNLTLEIEGKIIVGEIKRKAEAKAQYEAARQRGESAGYIGTKHRETNRFNLAITAAPNSNVAFNLTYQEVLQRKHGYYEQVIYIDPGQTVPEMDVTVSILESRNITKLSVPPLRNDLGTDLIDLDTITVIQRPTPKSAYVKFVPSVTQQLAQTESGMSGQFVVKYDVDRKMDAGDILVVNGYFVHFFAPEGIEPIPNDALFILDTSGSMAGTKITQLKEAMRSILKVLNEGDRINILTFSSTPSFWKTEMQDASDEDTLEEAFNFIDSIVARGGTNINAALVDGIRFLRSLRETDPDIRSPVIVFLTDGQATTGVTHDGEILSNIMNAKQNENIPIFSLAFGTNADYDIVKKIAIQNNGFGRRIYEASDAAMQITGLYSEISLTLLKNLTFNYLDVPVSNLTQHHYETYFSGSEVIIAGKVNDDIVGSVPQMKMRVTSNSVGGSNVLVLSSQFEPGLAEMENLTKLGDFEKMTEKVWAYLTIKQLLDKKESTQDQTENLGYNKKILELSLLYDFVTPLTSMVVTQDDEDGREDDKQVSVFSDATKAVGRGTGLRTVAAGTMPMQQYAKTGGTVMNSYQGLPGGGRHANSPPMKIPTSGSRGSRFRKPNNRYYSVPSLDFMDTGNDFSPKSAKVESTARKSRKRMSKKKKGNKKRTKALFKAPIMMKVQSVDSPLCLQLKSDQINNGDSYLLYLDSTLDLKILAEVETKPYRRRSVQTLLKSVSVSTGNISKVFTSSNESHVRMDLQNVAEVKKEYNIDAGAFSLLVTSVGDTLSIYVTPNGSRNPTDEGILGSILSKKMKLKERKGHATPKKRKATGLLKFDKTGVKVKQFRTQPSSTPSAGSFCWVMKKEIVMYDMQAFKFTQ